MDVILSNEVAIFVGIELAFEHFCVGNMTDAKKHCAGRKIVTFICLYVAQAQPGDVLFTHIENVFDGLSVKEYCIFAANYLWPQKTFGQEVLVLVIRLEPGQEFSDSLKNDIIVRNRRLPDFKRVGGYLIWDQDFPRTASMKIKRTVLADEIGKNQNFESIVIEL